MAARVIGQGPATSRRYSAGRRVAAALVVLAVAVAHAWVSRAVADGRAQWDAHAAPPVHRMDVAFVRELAPTAPPAVAPRPAAPAPPRAQPVPPAVAPAASAPEAVRDAEPPTPSPGEPPMSEVDTALRVPPPEPDPAGAEAAAEPAGAEPATAGSAEAPVFEWPPSTRLSYSLLGDYRGEVHGSAQVQWVRIGSRYQVHLDVHAALVVSRRITSDGQLGPDGLRPQRYDEETRFLFYEPRMVTLHFEPDRIVTARGRVRPTLSGVQDTASQFVQLTYLFTTQPELLRPGQTIVLPLALPRHNKMVVLDVVGEERLITPIGELDTVHVRPRHDGQPNPDFTAEMWFAPTLQYLPVRIRLRQGEIQADLLIKTPPLQAEATGGPAVPTTEGPAAPASPRDTLQNLWSVRLVRVLTA